MNHYETLGVPKNADANTIKRAYRKASSKAHPDRNGGDNARMVAVNCAYETLIDPERRRRHDNGDDRAAPPPFDQRAMEIAMHLFAQCMEQLPESADIIAYVSNSISANLERMHGAMADQKAMIARSEKRRKRLNHTGKGRNFIDGLLVQRIGQCTERVEKIEEEIKLGDRALELLKEFSYEADAPQRPARTSSFFSTTHY